MLTLCQLILRKISKIGATRCQILRIKCIKFDFPWGSTPDHAYSAPPDSLAVFKGPISNGSEGEGEWSGRGRGRGCKGKGRGGNGREGPVKSVKLRARKVASPPLTKRFIFSV